LPVDRIKQPSYHAGERRSGARAAANPIAGSESRASVPRPRMSGKNDRSR